MTGNNDDVLSKFLDFDESAKDETWATEQVRLVKMNARHLISKEEYFRLKNILTGEFPDINFDAIFASPSMAAVRKKISKNTVDFFQKTLNALIDDRVNSGLSISVNSLDPTKEEKRKSDKQLLKERQAIEGVMNEVTSGNGMPPIKITADEFHGNVEMFEKNNYDEFDPVDLNSFFADHWALKAEIYYQDPINDTMRHNQVSRQFPDKITDILIDMKNCSQVYVDDMEGKIKVKHLHPWEPKVFQATCSSDYKDAGGWDVPKSTNIRGFMKMFGTYFNFERDFALLLRGGLSSSGITNYEKINSISYEGSVRYGSGTIEECITWEMFLDLPISYGYCEWKTISRLRKQMGVTAEGNLIPNYLEKDSDAVDSMPVEKKYWEDTYRAYYFDLGLNEPKIIKWGKQYMMLIDGLEDEYSGFSIKVNSRAGKSMAKVFEPYWNILNFTFKMLEMLITDIKPDGLILNFESMMKIAAWMQTAKDVPTDIKSGVDAYLLMAQDSVNLITANQETPEGQPMGGGNSGVSVRKNGLNGAAPDLLKIMDWIELKVSSYTATQALDNAEPRDGYKLSIENKKRSRAATAFIDYILLTHLEDISISVLNYTQVISKFKETLAYKYLAGAVGDKTMEFISNTTKAAHRYGIYLDTFNNDITLLEIKQTAQQALLQGQLSYEQYMNICSFESPKKAAAYMAYERAKADRKRQQEAQAALQGQSALQKQKDDNLFKIKEMEARYRVSDSKSQAQGFIQAANINANASITGKQISEQGQNARQSNEAINEINKIAAESEAESQKPVL